MEVDDLVLCALDVVLAWDLPDEACGAAVSDLAALMAGAST